MTVGAFAFGSAFVIDVLGALLTRDPALFVAVDALRSPLYTIGIVLFAGGTVVRRLLRRREERSKRDDPSRRASS